MLASVVGRVRRRLRRSQKPQEQPPDLRRWSNFMNPFPHVLPGGYKRYYEKHGLPEPNPPLPTTPLHTSPRPASSPRSTHARPSQVGSYTISEPVPFPSPSPYLPSSSSTARRKAKKALSTIREVPIILVGGNAPVRAPKISNTSSLKRKQRQLLRTPSVERDWPNTPSVIDLFDSSSQQSHSSSSPHTYPADTPPTTYEGGFEEDMDSPISAKTGAEYNEEGYGIDRYARSESRSSYCTARSGFSDD